MAAGDGLISMTPTSIAHSGTSASINADGGVDFTAVTELNLNGVFTSDYDNYLMVITSVSSTSPNIAIRFRSSGSDATGTDYTYQGIIANGTNVTAARTTSQTSALVGEIDSTSPNGEMIHIYGPALAQPTAVRNVNVSDGNDAKITDFASTHSLSTSYDGVTVFPPGTDFTGNIHVFGYEE